MAVPVQVSYKGISCKKLCIIDDGECKKNIIYFQFLFGDPHRTGTLKPLSESTLTGAKEFRSPKLISYTILIVSHVLPENCMIQPRMWVCSKWPRSRNQTLGRDLSVVGVGVAKTPKIQCTKIKIFGQLPTLATFVPIFF